MKNIWKLIIPLLLSICSLPVLGQSGKMYTIYDGLSSTDIKQILQDYKGFIWLATNNGLNRFDGDKFSVYNSDHTDSSALKSNTITTLFEDKKQNLWIGTADGLWRYNREYDNFIRIEEVGALGEKFNSHVMKITETKKYGLLVATSGHKIFRLNNDNELEYIREVDDGLMSGYINDIYEDQHQNLYVNIENEGVFVKRYQSDKYECILHHGNGVTESCIYSNKGIGIIINTNKGILKVDNITFNMTPLATGIIDVIKGLCTTAYGKTWIYTAKGDICFFDERGSLHSYNDPILNEMLHNNRIETLYEDHFKNLWIVVKNKGIYIQTFTGNSFRNNVMSNQKSLCMHDEGNEFWVGTENNGIFIYNKDKNECVKHLFQNLSIYDIFKDTQGRIWVASDNGLILMTKENYTIVKQFKHDPNKPNSIPTDKIWNITQDGKGYLWIGTCAKGICRIDDIENGLFSVFDDIYRPQLYKNRLSNNWILNVAVDADDHLWIGTTNGLSEYIPEQKKFLSYFCSGSDEPGKMIEVVAIVNKEVWVGTPDGIYIFKKDKGKWMHLGVDSFPPTVIKGLQVDGQGNVWVSSINCLYKINPTNYKYEKYTENSGIYVTNYSRGSSTLSIDGVVSFGGANGVVSFLPLNIIKKKMEGTLAFTELLLFNKTVKAGEKINNNVVIEKAIDETEHIILPYEDCFLTIGFKVLNFSDASDIIYSYQMKGYDKQWQIISEKGEKKATYTNLSPGNYWFIVKAEQGGIEQMRQIKVIILPPWWLSIYMKICYLLFLIFCIGSIVYYFYRRNIKKLEKQHLEHLAQLSEMKLQFFVDISHEIRTPLTLILTPLEKLYYSSDKVNKMVYKTMYYNAKRLLRLVNQLIDVRKIDKGRLVLQVERIEMNNYIRKVVADFQLYADEKRIKIEIDSLYPKIYAFIDPVNFEKIISNLLSNALKFSPENSLVTIKINLVKGSPSCLHIAVRDQGIGVPQDMVKTVFDRFVQADNGKKNQGTGIGLHLCRQLTTLHSGKIWVENGETKGAVFCVEIPLGKRHFVNDETEVIIKASETFVEADSETDYLKKEDAIPIISKTLDAIQDATSVAKRYTILIADDESDIRNYLKSELSRSYNILECDNGEDTMKTVISVCPDLIICDIMMPDMDGITICKKIRSNYNIAHLPIILLTAKVNLESVHEGIAAGADEYMTKPFNMNLLQMKIKKLIEMRVKLQYRYGKDLKFEVQEGNNTSPDEKLKERINEVVRNYLSDSELNVGFLCKEVGYSRVHLNRKLKEFYNMSPHEYIKVTRMKQAAILLKENKLNISEIAYSVGFSNPAHFTASFREFYGKAPKEYISNNSD